MNTFDEIAAEIRSPVVVKFQRASDAELAEQMSILSALTAALDRDDREAFGLVLAPIADDPEKLGGLLYLAITGCCELGRRVLEAGSG